MNEIGNDVYEHENKYLVLLITCGSFDDGKSAQIGRLLFDSKLISMWLTALKGTNVAGRSPELTPWFTIERLKILNQPNELLVVAHGEWASEGVSPSIMIGDALAINRTWKPCWDCWLISA